MELIKSFGPGVLDRYRKAASFDWKKLRVLVETEDIIKFKEEVINEIKKNVECHPPTKALSFSELRKESAIRARHLKFISHMNPLNMIDNFRKFAAAVELRVQFDPSASVKDMLSSGMFVSVLHSLGSEDHIPIAEKVQNGEAIGCFALTEIAHGSNTKAMQTTATYDLEKKCYIINTPNFEAAKCWIGNLGHSATHVIVYAQLYTPDGKCHGLHQFVVQIRDMKSLMPCPGVIVGDLGEKVGLNGIDNGFLMFQNKCLPRTALLNKNAEICELGTYKSKFENTNKMMGASLAALSAGRINIGVICTAYLLKAVTIAVRYSAVRKQFGPNKDEELPVLEYQLQQYRLLPYLAGAYALKLFSHFLATAHFERTVNSYMGVKATDGPEFGIEVHGISSASKPMLSWFTRDAIQECREACGGHGYLKAAQLGELRNDHDAACTYEGENNVLIQQTSNWLLKLWPLASKGLKIETPMHSVDFLTYAKMILDGKFDVEKIEEIERPEYILTMYQWLVCYLLKSTHEKYQKNISLGLDPFTARNENQVFYAKNLALAYIQHFVLYRFMIFINETEDPAIKNVLVRMFGLYGLFSLEKHIGHMYQGGFFIGEKPASLIQDAILHLCKSLKDDAVSLVDAIAPDDFLLNSVLGHSDGEVYKHMQTSFFTGENHLSRPEWWQEIIQKPSKL